MEITAHYTPADGLRAQKYVTRRMFRGSPWRYLPFFWDFSYGFLIGIGGMQIFYFTRDYCGPINQRLIWGLGLLAAGIVILGAASRVAAVASRKVVLRPGSSFLTPQVFSVTNRGLTQRSKNSEHITYWSGIEGLEEDTNYLYLFHDRGVATYIPRSAFPNHTAIQEFVELVNRYVSKTKG
jgi:hypothetical protein